MKIIAVNGREFSGTALRNAVADAVKNTKPIALIVRDGEYYRTCSIDYQGGEKYPRLQRDVSKPDLLADIIRPPSYRSPAPGEHDRRHFSCPASQHAAAQGFGPGSAAFSAITGLIFYGFFGFLGWGAMLSFHIPKRLRILYRRFPADSCL